MFIKMEPWSSLRKVELSIVGTKFLAVRRSLDDLTVVFEG